MQDQQSVDKDGNEMVVKGRGRHDPCVLPRAGHYRKYGCSVLTWTTS